MIGVGFRSNLGLILGIGCSIPTTGSIFKRWQDHITVDPDVLVAKSNGHGHPAGGGLRAGTCLGRVERGRHPSELSPPSTGGHPRLRRLLDLLRSDALACSSDGPPARPLRPERPPPSRASFRSSHQPRPLPLPRTPSCLPTPGAESWSRPPMTKAIAYPVKSCSLDFAFARPSGRDASISSRRSCCAIRSPSEFTGRRVPGGAPPEP